MPTNYPGREDEHDLGDGHSFVWLHAGGEDQPRQLIGLVEHHPLPEPGKFCGGFIAWVDDEHSRTVAKHQLIAGGPGDEAHLIVAPSLLCPRCGNHGFIRDGRWVPA